MGYAHIDLESRTAHVCGVTIHIEVKAGSYRQKIGKTPILFSDHYGEIIGLTGGSRLDSIGSSGIAMGADGEPIDCYIGPYPENNDAIYIINQSNRDGDFDEHKVMFGFLDMDHARNVYRNSCHGKEPMSMVSCTKPQFLFWLEHGNHNAPIAAQSFPFDTYSEIAMEQAKEFNGQPANRVLYDMRLMDKHYQQLDEPMDFEALLDEVTFNDGGDFAVLDALVIPNVQLEKKAKQIGLALNRNAGGDVKLVDDGGVEVTEPYKQHGTTNVAMLFNFTDGQTVSVFLHNPDSTPNKLAPDDNLVAWKWLLNKKDITIVVAKENGQDQSIMAIAKKVMALVDANTRKFSRANVKAAENEAAIKATEERIEQKKNVLQDLLDQIAALESGAGANQSLPTEPNNPNNSVPGITELDESQLEPFEMPIGENLTSKDVKKALENWLSQLQGKTIITVDNKTVRFSKKSKMHLVTDSIYNKYFVPKAITKILEVFKTGEALGRQDLYKTRIDNFVAFHVYRKWVMVDDKEILLQVKAGELHDGNLESEIGLIAYSAKDIEKESPYSATSNTATDVPRGQADSFNNDNATLDSVQEDEVYFIEILEIRDVNQKSQLPEGAFEPEPTPEPQSQDGTKYSTNGDGDEINPDAQTIEAMKTALKELQSLGYTVSDTGFEAGGVVASDGQVDFTFDYTDYYGLLVQYQDTVTHEEDLLVSEREYSGTRQPLTADQIVKEIVALSASQMISVIETFKYDKDDDIVHKSNEFIGALLIIQKAAQQAEVNLSWGNFGGSYSGGLFDKANTGFSFLESLPKDLDYGAVAQIGLGDVVIGRVEASEQGEIGVLIGNAGTKYQASGLKILSQVVQAFNQLKETSQAEPTPEPVNNPEPVAIEPEPTPEPTPEPAPMNQFEKEREFLEQMIAGQLDVMDEPTGDRLMEIAEKFDGSEEYPDMVALLNQAVSAYTAQLDLLSQS